MRRDENSRDQLRRAEKRREDMRWDVLAQLTQIISALPWPKTCSKTGSRRQSHKKYDFDAFLKANFKGDGRAKNAKNHQELISASLRFANSKVQKTMKLRAEQQRRATLTQPLQCDLQTPSCKRQWNCTRSSNIEWWSDFNAICKQWAAKDHRTTSKQQVAEADRLNRIIY